MLQRLRENIERLVQDGYLLLGEVDKLSSIPGLLGSEKERVRLSRAVNERYYAWYNAARPLVETNLRESFSEFQGFYLVVGPQAQRLLTSANEVDDSALQKFERAFATQLGIVGSIPRALEAKALGLRGLLARDLMEDELTVARHLLENGYVREAGAIAGVVLEHHLRLMCEKRGEGVDKRDAIGSLNDKLRKHYPHDSEYRRVQWMNEIRATCAHDKPSQPESNKVEQLISAIQDFMSAIS